MVDWNFTLVEVSNEKHTFIFITWISHCCAEEENQLIKFCLYLQWMLREMRLDTEGGTPIEIEKKKRKTEIIALLIEFGWDQSFEFHSSMIYISTR